MTTPGRAVKIVMRQRVAARSIWIFGTDADSSFFFRMSRIRRSSASNLPNSFFSAYHFERQSLLTAMRSPIGLVFCPITKPRQGQPFRLSPVQRLQSYVYSFGVGRRDVRPSVSFVRQNDPDVAAPFPDRPGGTTRFRDDAPHRCRRLSERLFHPKLLGGEFVLRIQKTLIHRQLTRVLAALLSVAGGSQLALQIN